VFAGKTRAEKKRRYSKGLVQGKSNLEGEKVRWGEIKKNSGIQIRKGPSPDKKLQRGGGEGGGLIGKGRELCKERGGRV